MKGIKFAGRWALFFSLIYTACTATESVPTAQQLATISPTVDITPSRVEPSLPVFTPTRRDPTATKRQPDLGTPTSSQITPTQSNSVPLSTGASPYPAPSIETVIPSPTATQTTLASPSETPIPALPVVVTPGEGTDLAPGGWQPSSGSYPAPGVETTGALQQPTISATSSPTVQSIPPTPTGGTTLTEAPPPVPGTTQPSSPYPGPAITPSPFTPGAVPASPTGQAGGSQNSSPYPDPENPPSPTSTPGFDPTLTPPGTSPGVTPTPTPVITGTVTLSPSTHFVVRVTQKVTNPATVRLDAGQLQLVEFFAGWSNLSKSMAPVLNGLEANYSGKILFTYLDVDNRANTRFKQALGYQFPPHLFLLDGQGQVLKVWKGYVRVEDLEVAFSSQGITP